MVNVNVKHTAIEPDLSVGEDPLYGDTSKILHDFDPERLYLRFSNYSVEAVSYAVKLRYVQLKKSSVFYVQKGRRMGYHVTLDTTRITNKCNRLDEKGVLLVEDFLQQAKALGVNFYTYRVKSIGLITLSANYGNMLLYGYVDPCGKLVLKANVGLRGSMIALLIRNFRKNTQVTNHLFNVELRQGNMRQSKR